MTLIVETGAGIQEANSNVTVEFVTAYLTDRNRATDWSAATSAVKIASVIAATDYIELVFANRFRGSREFNFTGRVATATVTFSGLPTDAETLQIGKIVYTFVAALSGVINEVLIGSDAAETASNLVDAISALAAGEGSTFGAGTDVNRAVVATLLGAVVTLTAAVEGTAGNYITLAGTPTNVVLVAFSKGLDYGSQPLSFPRVGLYDESGNAVLGMPLRVMQATAEYADRARVAILAPDPTVDAQGGAIIRLREKVGPIETETEYEAGTNLRITLHPYPAADRLLSGFLASKQGAYR